MQSSERSLSGARIDVRGREASQGLSQELSAAQHQFIRGQLALIPVHVWAIYAWLSLFTQLSADPTPVRDFMHFYAQGAVANLRDARALYDAEAQATLLASLVAGATGVRFLPVYGPQVAVLFSPLARLPYATALGVWQAFTVLAYAACAWALWRSSATLRTRRWNVLVLVAAAPALRFVLGSGQTAVLALICVTLGFLAFRAGRPLLAGLAIGALAYKPQLGLVAAFVFVFAGEWRVVIGAVMSAVAQIACGCLFWGVEILDPYSKALQRLPAVASDMEPLKHQMHSWRPFFDLLGLPSDVAAGFYVLAAMATLATALACWRSKGPLSARYAALLLATVLVNPHLYAYDLLVIVPALLLLWDWVTLEPDRSLDAHLPVLARTPIGRWRFRALFVALLYVGYFSAAFGALAATTRVQLSVVIHSLLLGVVAHACSDRRRAPTERTVAG